jgi:4-amino-4-deoxy-L-arabinose transferase-like glycosyltransferase
MPRNRPPWLLALAFVVAWAVRINNALTYPALRAFDGFGHFTYIWFMAENWRIPPPTSGWSFFHPPLYYWLMASIWNLLSGFDPVARLRAGTCLTATLGLAQAAVAWTITRRWFPRDPLWPALAAILMLFLPVHVFTAGYLGNESLNAVLSSIAVLVLLWTLRKPDVPRCLVLGICLGLAMLTKFTAVAIVAASFASLGLQTLARRDWKRGVVAIATVGAAMLPICGWFYARNIIEYHDPFKVSRDEFMVRRHEDLQTCGKRDLLEYLLFDPLIVLRPQWPRGIPLTGDLPFGVEHSSLRESVWTGAFANTFFDAVGAQVLPPVTVSDVSRHAGQVMLSLGLVPTVLVLVGLGTGLMRIRRYGWDDTLVPLLLAFAAALALFIQATRTVPMNAAVKATYLTPASVLFAFWFAVGAERVAASRPLLRRLLGTWGVVFPVATTIVFSNGVFLERHWLDDASTKSPVWQNLYGVVYYAGGWHERARELFETGLATSWHLSYENLATMALDEGRPLEALYDIRSAARMQPTQSFGTPPDKIIYERTTQAEYSNTMAVIYDRLGWADAALASARRAVELDPTIPESNYDLALLTLKSVLKPDGSRDPDRLAAALERSRSLIVTAVSADPAFFEARALAGSATILEGNCAAGEKMLRTELAPHPGRYRFYPVSTGLGDIMAAAVRRRMHLALPRELAPDSLPAWCSAGQDASSGS